jgi:hypothetical protein
MSLAPVCHHEFRGSVQLPNSEQLISPEFLGLQKGASAKNPESNKSEIGKQEDPESRGVPLRQPLLSPAPLRSA